MKKLLQEFNNAPMITWAVTTALVVLFAVVPATSFHLDDNSGEHGAAKDAIAQQRQQARFDKAIKEMGRENGACFQTDKPGEIQCFTHRGAKTITAKVTP